MASPTLDGAPTVDELRAAIDCPIQRAALVTEIGRKVGTIPGPLAKLRRADLNEARHTLKKSAGYLAAHVGLSRTRIFQLTRTAGQEA